MIVNVINTSNNNLPKYETSLSAGMDVKADFSKITPENTIKALEIAKFSLSLKPIK